MDTQQTVSLYSKIISVPKKITWFDIFRTEKKKHTRSDVDYAMVAGTTLDTVSTELGMLQKWQQPWLYRRILSVGTILCVVIIASICITISMYGYCDFPALNLLLIVIPPCIVPLSLMVFFWELNAPRDISLMQLISYFFVGGVLSLTLTAVLNPFSPTGGAEMAPFAEEPAKLLVTLVLLKLLHKKNGAIYGFSGLALGAAVGAGFAAFESAQYAYNMLPTFLIDTDAGALYLPVMLLDMTALISVLVNIVVRNVCAICSHVLYCAPYACAAALNMNKGGNVFQAVCSLPFWILFGISFACHGLWNFIGSLMLLIPITLILWSTTLYGVRRSFAQLSEQVSMGGSKVQSTHLMLQGIGGVHAGVTFSITRKEILIGSDAFCQLNYPISLTDIEDIHCKLVVRQGNLYLADLGSLSGTFLNGIQLKPMVGHLLQRGDRFAIGTSGQEFQII